MAPTGLAEREIGRKDVVLDHRQDDGRRAHLQERGHLAAVGVADDDVEAPVALTVAMRFVPGVHDRALEGGLQPDLLLEEVGPLAELERDLTRRDARRLAPHLPGAAEHLPGHEVGRDLRDQPTKRELPSQQVVLVAAVAGALAVRVVLVDDDLGPIGEQAVRRHHRPLEDLLRRSVEHHHLAGVDAFGRGHLGVGVVDVVPGAVGEDGVDQMGLHVRRQRALDGEAAGVDPRALVLEVPDRSPVERGDVGVDQHGRRRDGVGVGPAHRDAVLGLDAAHLADRHGRTLSEPLRNGARPRHRLRGRRRRRTSTRGR